MLKLVVLSCLLAVSAAQLYPLGYPGYLGYPAYLGFHDGNYRGPLSLAPGQPANVLGADGRPLDTLDVNLDKSAHITAKALAGVHFLKKRSVGLVAPVARYSLPAAPLAYPAASLAYTAPLAHYGHIAAPLTTAYATPYIHY